MTLLASDAAARRLGWLSPRWESRTRSARRLDLPHRVARWHRSPRPAVRPPVVEVDARTRIHPSNDASHHALHTDDEAGAGAGVTPI